MTAGISSLGSSLSNAFAGGIVQRSGYDAAFLVLAGTAVATLAVRWFFVPETRTEVAGYESIRREGLVAW